MTKINFDNAFALATYFTEKNPDPREWGEIRNFENSQDWKNYYWDKKLKYDRDEICVREYEEAKHNCIEKFAQYINTKLTFPLVYISRCIEADGYGAYYSVTYINNKELIDEINTLEMEINLLMEEARKKNDKLITLIKNANN